MPSPRDEMMHKWRCPMALPMCVCVYREREIHLYRVLHKYRIHSLVQDHVHNAAKCKNVRICQDNSESICSKGICERSTTGSD